MISSARDGTIRVWSVPLGVELLTLRGFGHQVSGLEFDHTGKRLFVAIRRFHGANNTVAELKVFDLPSEEECMADLLQPSPVFNTAAGDERLVTGLVHWRKGAALPHGTPERDQHLQKARDLMRAASATELDTARTQVWLRQLGAP